MAARPSQRRGVLAETDAGVYPIDLVKMARDIQPRNEFSPYLAKLAAMGVPLLERQHPKLASWARNSSVAKRIGGGVALQAGALAGLPRGMEHTADDLVNSAVFLSRLMFPMGDPPGRTAEDQLFGAARGVLNYGRSRMAHRGLLANDTRQAWRRVQTALDPDATPAADTLSGELKRNFGIGQNRGELAVGLGSAFMGPAAVRTAVAVKPLSAEARVAMLARQGFDEDQIAKLSVPYTDRMHLIPSRAKWPQQVPGVGGQYLPKSVIDSDWNVRRAPELSKAEGNTEHFKNDDRYFGSGIKERGKGEGWSGLRLGLTRRPMIDRIWFGAPDRLKNAVFWNPARGVLAYRPVDDSLQEGAR